MNGNDGQSSDEAVHKVHDHAEISDRSASRPMTTPQLSGDALSWWRTSAAVAAGVFILSMVANWHAVISLVAEWWRSSDYQHAFLIIPISAYIAWQKREQLARVTPRPSLLGLLALAGLAFGWLLAYLVDVEVVQWFCVIAVIPVTVWSVLGLQATRVLLFPLCYLLLAMPIWGLLTPPLQSMTVAVSAAVLRALGVPLFVEANYLQIPSGIFVIQGFCGGLRYLLAAVSIGVLFCYLSYARWKQRIGSIAMVVGYALVLNWVRVVLVVALGHATEMQHPLVSDHLMLGWIIFGVGLIPLYFLVRGVFPLEPQIPAAAGTRSPTIQHAATRLAFVGTLAAVMVALPGIGAGALKSTPSAIRVAPINLPALPAPWTASADDWPLGASFHGAGAETAYRVTGAEQPLYLYVALYGRQRQGAELISETNSVYDREHWRPARSTDLAPQSVPFRVEEVLLRSDNYTVARQLVWYWYFCGGHFTSDPIVAKLLQAWGTLQGKRLGAALAIATSARPSPDAARRLLAEFLAENHQDITATLRDLEVR